MIIYKLTFANGKIYIGQTVKMLHMRLSAHKAQVTAGSSLPVHCAWRKYGEPDASVIARCGSTAELHASEIALIARHRSVSPGGYNVTAGGDTSPAKVPAVAAKIAAKARGRTVSPETRAKIAAAAKANWQSPEYRAKVDVAVRASWTPAMRAATAERTRKRMTGHKHSPETRAKLVAGKAIISPETRAKMSASAKSRVRADRSDATKAKVSASTAATWRDPDIRARRAAAIREGHRRNKELRGVVS